MFHLTTLIVTLFVLASGLRVLAQTLTTTLAFDTTYDNSDLSLNSVACSDGPGDLESKGYTTLGSIPSYPSLGGVFTVTGWDAPACGACYAVTYSGNTVNILAVDKSTEGFTVSKQAMDNLTGGQATDLGRVTVSYEQVDVTACKLPSQ